MMMMSQLKMTMTMITMRTMMMPIRVEMKVIGSGKVCVCRKMLAEVAIGTVLGCSDP
jgi:hypothetical protein